MSKFYEDLEVMKMNDKTGIAIGLGALAIIFLLLFIKIGIVLLIIVGIIMAIEKFVFAMDPTFTAWLFWSLVPAGIISAIGTFVAALGIFQ